jgi:L-serine dehydratase
MGLSGADPVTVPVDEVSNLPERIMKEKTLHLGGTHPIFFDPADHIFFQMYESLPYHPNGMTLAAFDQEGELLYKGTYFSVGGGFIIKENETMVDTGVFLPYPINSGEDLLKYCAEKKCSIADIVWENEKVWRSPEETEEGVWAIWQVMKQSVHRGCHTEGPLPGGLQVNRRANAICRRILGDCARLTQDEWVLCIKDTHKEFSKVLRLVGAFAMAVNEENANFGRIVTAPTNGAAGVIPAVLFYFMCFTEKDVQREDIIRFLLVASEVGSIFKKGSTISAAMGGCQAEIGVSSAMAAAALTEGLGGSPGQALMAAEIAMEHHLGLTCDPIGGLVQVPCIERNSMGAVKAITAANIALESDPSLAKVSLDAVVRTMFETARDMNTKYKETSLGGLAVQIALALPEC